MNQFVALPDLGPSTLLSFSADTSLPPTQVEDWTAPTWSDSWGEAKRTVDGASSSLPSSSHEPTRTKWAAAAASANRQQYRVSRRFERRREELGLTFRKALEDDLEDLSDQEDRVYRAEVSGCIPIIFFGSSPIQQRRSLYFFYLCCCVGKSESNR